MQCGPCNDPEDRQGQHCGGGADSLAIADQEPISISHQWDQDAEQHLGNTSEEHQGQGMTSSSARHQDSEDSHTLLDSMVEVQQKIRFCSLALVSR